MAHLQRPAEPGKLHPLNHLKPPHLSAISQRRPLPSHSNLFTPRHTKTLIRLHHKILIIALHKRLLHPPLKLPELRLLRVTQHLNPILLGFGLAVPASPRGVRGQRHVHVYVHLQQYELSEEESHAFCASQARLFEFGCGYEGVACGYWRGVCELCWVAAGVRSPVYHHM